MLEEDEPKEDSPTDSPAVESLPEPTNSRGAGRSSRAFPWELIGHTKRVAKGWEYLAANWPESTQKCYEWLRSHPMKPRGQTCFCMKGKLYKGAWEYEIANGNRVYYKPIESERKVIVYYAGKHPKQSAPTPP